MLLVCLAFRHSLVLVCSMFIFKMKCELSSVNNIEKMAVHYPSEKEKGCDETQKVYDFSFQQFLLLYLTVIKATPSTALFCTMYLYHNIGKHIFG